MDPTLAALLFLTDSADELEKLLGAQWIEAREQLASLIFANETEAPGALDIRAADLFMERLLDGPAAPIVRKAFSTNETKDPLRLTVPEREYHLASNSDGCLVLPVYYGTDRRWHGGGEPNQWYSTERGPLECGFVQVSLPARYRVGEINGPRWWKLEFQPDPTRHVIVFGIERLSREKFAAELQTTFGADDQRELLVFVHGYNVSFPAAARQAAQIARDLRFGGQTAVYSWPSQARKLWYSADEGSVEASIPNLEQFLYLLLCETGARRLHIVTHSMGSRAVAYVLKKLNTAARPAGSAVLGQVIFAAPDVDRDVFARCLGAFRGSAERFTLYASSGDLALRVSKMLHRFARAGEAGPALMIQEGLDTVDASSVDTSIFGLGHSYFANRRSILNDMFGAIRNGLPPNRRFDLTSANSPGGPYWIYQS